MCDLILLVSSKFLNVSGSNKTFFVKIIASLKELQPNFNYHKRNKYCSQSHLIKILVHQAFLLLTRVTSVPDVTKNQRLFHFLDFSELHC